MPGHCAYAIPHAALRRPQGRTHDTPQAGGGFPAARPLGNVLTGSKNLGSMSLGGRYADQGDRGRGR